MSQDETLKQANDASGASFGKQSAFAWRTASAMLTGYLLSTVPQVILDPLLVSEITYGRRTYPFAFMIVPIGVLVFVATFLITLKAIPLFRLTAVLPFVAGCFVSAPIFTPALHGNLLFAGTVWLLIAVLAVWVHGLVIVDPSKSTSNVAQQARIEYVKEQIAFWKGLGYALLAAFIGTLVALVQSLHAANTEFVTTKADLYLMGRYINVEVTLFSLFMIFGPLYEIARKILAVSQLLLEIRDATTTA